MSKEGPDQMNILLLQCSIRQLHEYLSLLLSMTQMLFNCWYFYTVDRDM